MINKWRLENFKSVYEKIELDLKPLTVFAGANSSGKSTFIQSMLLTWQTLNNQVYSRPIILNGHIIRLGTFNDLASAGSNLENVTIGFELRPPQQYPSSRGTVPRLFQIRRPMRTRFEELEALNCDFLFTAKDDPKDISQLQPLLCHFRLSCKIIDEPHSDTIEIRRLPDRKDRIINEYRIPPEDYSAEELSALDYDIVKKKTLVSKRRRFAFREPRGGEIVGCRFNHFLPFHIILVYDSIEERALQIVGEFWEVKSPSRRKVFPFSEDDKPYLNEAFLQKLNEIFQMYASKPSDHVLPPLRKRIAEVAARLKEAVDISNLLDAFSLITKVERAELIRKHEKELVKLSRGDRQPKRALAQVRLPENISDGIVLIRSFFARSFKYLGPLRDEPKAVYPMQGAVEPTDIGLRGEFTAAVLGLHKDTTIEYLPSSYFDEKKDITETNRTTLQNAVLDWLKYMGVVEEVQTKDLGIYGHELKVGTDLSGALHNLTHVGVGVSQVLPILVMSLLSEPDAVLVFEQPEIHLHPKVQSRLADFLLSMSLIGRQCIVETHSEYLINRLRYRSALANENNVADLVGIYFVEKQNGKSGYRPINVNEYGAITDWPEGFFDQSQREAEEILRAAMEKKRNKETGAND